MLQQKEYFPARDDLNFRKDWREQEEVCLRLAKPIRSSKSWQAFHVQRENEMHLEWWKELRNNACILEK